MVRKMVRKTLEEWNNDAMKHRKHLIASIIWTAVIVIFVLIVIFSTFYTIPAGHRGVLLTFGKPSMISQGEGIHIKAPFVQSVVSMDVRTQKYEAQLTAASQDLQDVATKIAINYHIEPERAPEIYQLIGISYADKVIYPLEQETNKGITAQFTAEELITRREEVRQKMKDALIQKLISRGIVVEEISIVDFKFSESFSTAIEAKVTAEQNALREQNNLRVIQFQAQQQVASAKGTAESIAIINAQLTKSPEYLQWQAIQKWNGVLPNVIGGANPFFDISSFMSKTQ